MESRNPGTAGAVPTSSQTSLTKISRSAAKHTVKNAPHHLHLAKSHATTVAVGRVVSAKHGMLPSVHSVAAEKNVRILHVVATTRSAASRGSKEFDKNKFIAHCERTHGKLAGAAVRNKRQQDWKI